DRGGAGRPRLRLRAPGDLSNPLAGGLTEARRLAYRRAMARVELFYDYSSPWTYLACSRIEELCRRCDAELVWRPILVGGIFNTVNPSVYETRAKPVPAKARYMLKDLQDWARYYGLQLVFPPSVFPVNSVKALRGALVALE